MPMVCLWPDCQDTYCKKKCPHQEEIQRANGGWEDFESNPMTPELQAEFDKAFNREFPQVPLHRSVRSATRARVVG